MGNLNPSAIAASNESGKDQGEGPRNSRGDVQVTFLLSVNKCPGGNLKERFEKTKSWWVGGEACQDRALGVWGWYSRYLHGSESKGRAARSLNLCTAS